MTARSTQKLKALYLLDILSRETDEKHGLTVPEITSRLEEQGLSPNRKTLYADLEALENYGLDIIRSQDGHLIRYHLVTRNFELPELSFWLTLSSHPNSSQRTNPGSSLRSLSPMSAGTMPIISTARS